MTWIDALSPLDPGSCFGGCWAPELGEFLGVGENDAVTEAIIRSADGIGWEYRSSPFDGGIGMGVVRAVVLGTYVAVGLSPDGVDAVITSPDGAAWTGAGNPFVNAPELVACAVRESDGALVAIGTDVLGAVKLTISTDDGASWSVLTPGAVTGLPGFHHVAVRQGDDAIFVAGISGGGDYAAVSLDGGATWTTSSPFGASGTVLGCAVRESDGALLAGGYDSGSEAVLGVSTDDGATWVTHLPFGASSFSAVTDVAVRQADDALFVTGRNAANNKYVAKSTDGGSTWTLSAPFGTAVLPAQAVAIRPSDGGLVVGGLNGAGSKQLAVSTDSGATYTLDAPYGGSSSSFTQGVAVRSSDGLLVAAAADEQLAVSGDGGTTWTRRSPFGGGRANDCAVRQGDGLLVAVGFSFSGVAQVVTSADDGATWTATTGLPLPLAGQGTCIACKQSTGRLILGGSDSTIVLASSPDGVAFDPIFSSPFNFGGEVAGIDSSANDDRWIAAGVDSGSAALAAYSDNDGSSWTTILTHPMDASAGQMPRVYRDDLNGRWWLLGQTTGGNAAAFSDDGGDTWTEVETPLDPVAGVGAAYAMVNVGGATLALAGRDSTGTKQMCYSEDAGATWALDASPSPFGTGYGRALAYAPTIPRAVAFGAETG